MDRMALRGYELPRDEGTPGQRECDGADLRGVRRDALSRLKNPSTFRFLSAVMGDWLAIVAALALARSLNGVVAHVLAVWFIGTRQHAIGIMGHEGTHRFASRKRWLNTALTQLLCMWPLHSDMHTYAEFHLGHHRHLNTPADPELKYRVMAKSSWKVPRRRRDFVAQFVIDLLGGGALESLRVLRFTGPQTIRGAIGPAFFTAAAVSACVVTAQYWILAMWYAAFFTGFPAVWRLRCWLEHMGSKDTHRVHVPGWAAWFFAPHGIWMHWEHHHFPGIPLHHLPAARALAQGVPVISVKELLDYYEACPSVEGGSATKNR